jgi:hypothetical protein
MAMLGRARGSAPVRSVRLTTAVALGVLLACGDHPPTTGPEELPKAGPAQFLTPAREAPTAAAEAPASPVFVGTGDIATCSTTRDEITAALLDGIAGTVFTTGDNAYPDGTTADFTSCYNPTWGRHKARTRPSPGNHDYHTSGAAAYYAYFGANAGPAGQGYYSFDLGAWHIISLNSNVAATSASPQMAWLRADLAAHPTTCAVAYWHHPVFSSGKHGNNSKMAAIWQVLDSAGVDLILSGHDHLYERFAPQTSTAQADPQGIREFVVGTGGAAAYQFPTIRANSEIRQTGTWGVLKLTLNPTSYDWAFVGQPGSTFSDAGSASCVGAPPPVNQPPGAQAGGPYSGNEGAAIPLSGAGSSDPEGQALTYAWSFGDGTSGTGVSPTTTYADNGSFTATLIVSDPAGLRDTATAPVTVANVRPRATFLAPSTSPAGLKYRLRLIKPTDVSSADVAAGFSYAFDCGAGFGAYGSASEVWCPGISTLGPRRVRGRIRDRDGGVAARTRTVTIVP